MTEMETGHCLYLPAGGKRCQGSKRTSALTHCQKPNHKNPKTTQKE